MFASSPGCTDGICDNLCGLEGFIVGEFILALTKIPTARLGPQFSEAKDTLTDPSMARWLDYEAEMYMTGKGQCSDVKHVSEFLRKVHTVVASNESIAVVASNLAIDDFFGLLQSDVHVSIYGL